jgi:hypothetical protein
MVCPNQIKAWSYRLSVTRFAWDQMRSIDQKSVVFFNKSIMP